MNHIIVNYSEDVLQDYSSWTLLFPYLEASDCYIVNFDGKTKDSIPDKIEQYTKVFENGFNQARCIHWIIPMDTLEADKAFEAHFRYQKSKHVFWLYSKGREDDIVQFDKHVFPSEKNTRAHYHRKGGTAKANDYSIQKHYITTTDTFASEYYQFSYFLFFFITRYIDNLSLIPEETFECGKLSKTDKKSAYTTISIDFDKANNSTKKHFEKHLIVYKKQLLEHQKTFKPKDEKQEVDLFKYETPFFSLKADTQSHFSFNIQDWEKKIHQSSKASLHDKDTYKGDWQNHILNKLEDFKVNFENYISDRYQYINSENGILNVNTIEKPSGSYLVTKEFHSEDGHVTNNIETHIKKLENEINNIKTKNKNTLLNKEDYFAFFKEVYDTIYSDIRSRLKQLPAFKYIALALIAFYAITIAAIFPFVVHKLGNFKWYAIPEYISAYRFTTSIFALITLVTSGMYLWYRKKIQRNIDSLCSTFFNAINEINKNLEVSIDKENIAQLNRRVSCHKNIILLKQHMRTLSNKQQEHTEQYKEIENLLGMKDLMNINEQKMNNEDYELYHKEKNKSATKLFNILILKQSS